MLKSYNSHKCMKINNKLLNFRVKNDKKNYKRVLIINICLGSKKNNKG